MADDDKDNDGLWLALVILVVLLAVSLGIYYTTK